MSNKENINFEEDMKMLEQIAIELEKGDLDLTLDMVRLFMILNRIDAFEKIK